MSEAANGRRARHWLTLAALLLGIGLCFYLVYQPFASHAAGARTSLRAAIIGLALGAWFRTQTMIGSRQLKEGAITDGVHELTAPVHHYLQAHPGQANTLLIMSSAGIDAFGLFLIGASLFGPTLRPFVALLILFAMRQVCQALCALPAPRDMIWRHPGFPSLLVTYGTANDFFFSGHTAVAVLGAIEIAHLGPPWLGVTAGVIAALEGLTVLVLRAHYTMDIVGAVFAAWAAAHAAGWLCGPL